MWWLKLGSASETTSVKNLFGPECLVKAWWRPGPHKQVLLEPGQEFRFPGSPVFMAVARTLDVCLLGVCRFSCGRWEMLVLCAVVSVGTFIRTSLVPRTEASLFLGSYLPKEEQQRERVPPSGSSAPAVCNPASPVPCTPVCSCWRMAVETLKQSFSACFPPGVTYWRS